MRLFHGYTVAMPHRWNRPGELNVLVILALVTYAGMGLLGWAQASPPEGTADGLMIWAWSTAFFLLGFLITMTAVLGGAAGGVLFTPFMLAFTPVDSLIIRATGMILALFAGLISSGSLMRAGLANLRLTLYGAAGYGLGALAGARGAVWVHRHMGATGEGMVRLSLGLILVYLIGRMLLQRGKAEWPEVSHVDRFTRFLALRQPYFEPSLGRLMDRPVTRAGAFFPAILVVGLISGFFGMGAGWAIVSAQNFIMGVPLKVAAANSVSIFGMGGSLAVWPYVHEGAVLPLFVAPWLSGAILGGLVAARLLVRVRAAVVRYLLLALMVFSAYGLLTRAAAMFGWLPEPSGFLTILVLTATFAVFFRLMIRAHRTRDPTAENRS